MRVAIVTAKFPCSERSEAFFAEEARALAARSDLIICPVAGGERSFFTVDARIVRTRLFSLQGVWRALRTLARRPVTCVRLARTFASKGAFRVRCKNFAVLPKAFEAADVLREAGAEHVHGYWLSTPATVAFAVSCINGIPFSVTAHRWDIYEQNLIDVKQGAATFVRTISERGRRDVLAMSVGADNVKCIHLGVRVPPRSAEIMSATKMRMLCAAALVPVKDHETLLCALAELQRRNVPFQCVFAGDGPLRETLRARALELAVLDSVQFAGFVPHANLLQQLQDSAFDVAVLSSGERGTEMEGIPVSLMEAMAAGVPCVATRSGSIEELIGPEEGVVVQCGDAVAFADALELLWRDRSRATAMGVAARLRIERDFNVERTAERLAQLFASRTIGNHR